jgi:hypothetical protein
MHDLMGREYARMSQLHAGDKVQVDADLTCIQAGSIAEVREGWEGCFYVTCREGRHYLAGQLMSDDGSLVGIYPVT